MNPELHTSADFSLLSRLCVADPADDLEALSRPWLAPPDGLSIELDEVPITAPRGEIATRPSHSASLDDLLARAAGSGDADRSVERSYFAEEEIGAEMVGSSNVGRTLLVVVLLLCALLLTCLLA